jgi:hypothetical protein
VTWVQKDLPVSFESIYRFRSKGFTGFVQKDSPVSFKRIYRFRSKGFTGLVQMDLPVSLERIYRFLVRPIPPAHVIKPRDNPFNGMPNHAQVDWTETVKTF